MKPLLTTLLMTSLLFAGCQKKLGAIIVKGSGPAGADLECTIVGWSADKQSVYIALPCKIKGTLATALPNNTANPVLDAKP